jgi:predicted dehydrogenase
MSEPVRVGLIGASLPGQGWAALAHLPALKSVPECKLVTVCTSREQTAQAAAITYGVDRAYHDHRALISDPEVELVSVVVKAPDHFDLVAAALRAGKHVYCEWPLAANLAQAEQLADLSRDHRVCAMVGLQGRADATILYCRELVQEGYVGEVLAVNMVMFTDGVLEHRQSRLWDRLRRNGASALTIRGIHSLDSLCFCAGELVELSARVTTQVKNWRVVETGETVDVEVPDNVLVHGTLQNGAVVSAHIATLPYNAPGWRMEMYGTKGTLRLCSDTAPQRSANRLYGAQGPSTMTALAVPDRFFPAFAGSPPGPARNVAHMYLRLARSVRAAAPVEPDFQVALQRHRLIDLIQRSSDEGRVVRV